MKIKMKKEIHIAAYSLLCISYFMVFATKKQNKKKSHIDFTIFMTTVHFNWLLYPPPHINSHI